MTNIFDYAEEKFGIDDKSMEMTKILASIINSSGLVDEIGEKPTHIEIMVDTEKK